MTYRLFDVEVVRRIQLSPSMVRLVFADPDVRHMAIGGPDQRIKVFFPSAGQATPQLPRDVNWYAGYRALPPTTRPPMRSYTIRRLDATVAEVEVDFVLHGDGGPASRWAIRARPGDRTVLSAPDGRDGAIVSGFEWRPPAGTRRLLLVGDETAVPAMAAILEHLADTGCGATIDVVLEVAGRDDMLSLRAPPQARIDWRARDGAAHGRCLLDALAGGAGPPGSAGPVVARPAHIPSGDAEIDIDRAILWETDSAAEAGGGLYVWMAGEAGAVVALRRHLVGVRGIDRRAIACMGYWRLGRSLD